MAAEARDPEAYEGLKKLADDYMGCAMEMERGEAVPVASNQNAAIKPEDATALLHNHGTTLGAARCSVRRAHAAVLS